MNKPSFSCVNASFPENFSGDYRFGFQGQETDPEYLSGAVSFKYRVHDARLGRFLSIDPLAPEYPWNSTYAFSENRTVDRVELEGLETGYPVNLYNPFSIPQQGFANFAAAVSGLVDNIFGGQIVFSNSESNSATLSVQKALLTFSYSSTTEVTTKTYLTDYLSSYGKGGQSVVKEEYTSVEIEGSAKVSRIPVSMSVGVKDDNTSELNLNIDFSYFKIGLFVDSEASYGFQGELKIPLADFENSVPETKQTSFKFESSSKVKIAIEDTSENEK